MGIVNIDGELFRKMIISGANALDKNKDIADALNVFPVPDGDTGTNMSLTFLAAAKEVQKLIDPDVCDVAKAVSSGSLRGARGNSGVILSQLFRGFAKGLEGCQVANTQDLSNAFIKASEMAYKAVMKPKEGTILTISKAMAEKAADMAFETEDTSEFILEVIKYGKEMLEKTTEMLPALKQAGVVDAGGYGLLCIWEGMYAGMHDSGEIDILDSENIKKPAVDVSAAHVFSNISSDDIKFAYCTEFIIDAKKDSEKNEDMLKEYFSSIGDSIVVVADDGVIKVHVHTNNPGQALEKALNIGSLDAIKIENMRVQHTNKIDFEQNQNNAKEKEEYVYDAPDYEENSNELGNNKEEKDVAFIVVSSGNGFKELFKNLGADKVIEGGQTMNPSAEDFIEAIEQINAKNIIIMPNNKNIILAAEQAATFVEDKDVVVLPTKSVPQGFGALINYSSINSVEENVEQMNEVIKDIITGQVTYAVRATVFEGNQIDQDDILCLIDGKIVLVAQSLQQGAKDLLDLMLEKKDSEIVSIFYGESANEEMAQDLLGYVCDKHPDIEAEVQNGGQPIYHYIFSVE